MIDDILQRLQDIEARFSRMPFLCYGTVVSTSPLRVRIDGDSEPIPYSPTYLQGAQFTQGGRVLVARIGKRLIVLGQLVGGS